MNMKLLLSGLLVGVSVTALAAASLTESTFTEIIKDAKVVAATTKSATPAQTNEVFRVPDLVRTGPDSRVEMTAPDNTITRIGANTVFTFEPLERTIQLKKGSVLFHAPAGAGGGSIKYHGTAAAVLGTTIICTVLPDGSFKTLVLEGQGQVTLRAGWAVTLNAGEMLTVRPDGNGFGPVMIFGLEDVVSRLQLVNGFSHPLSSLPLIAAAIQHQNQQIAAGNLGPITSWEVAGKGFGTSDGNGQANSLPAFLDLRNLGRESVSPSSPAQP